MVEMLRIVIAEDAAVIRAGLAEVLTDRGHEIVAAVGDAEALQAAVAEHKPDVAIVDVRMPPDHTDEGLRAAIAIRRDHPGTGILVFSQYVETRYAADLVSMRRGAHSAASGGRASATCSRTGSPTWPSSSTRSPASRPAAPRWTLRSSPAC